MSPSKTKKSESKNTPSTETNVEAVTVLCNEDGSYGFNIDGVKARELPTILRQAAVAAEKLLGIQS